MLRKQLELPPEIAKAFVRDMRAYFKAKEQNKRDEIAARQRSALSEFQGPREEASGHRRDQDVPRDEGPIVVKRIPGCSAARL
jgi:hypothetical protein